VADSRERIGDAQAEGGDGVSKNRGRLTPEQAEVIAARANLVLRSDLEDGPEFLVTFVTSNCDYSEVTGTVGRVIN